MCGVTNYIFGEVSERIPLRSRKLPGSWWSGSCGLKVAFSLQQSINLKAAVSPLRNVPLGRSWVFIHGLPVVKKFNFTCISLALVLLITTPQAMLSRGRKNHTRLKLFIAGMEKHGRGHLGLSPLSERSPQRGAPPTPFSPQ